MTTQSMPARRKRCARRSPAGPAPTMPTWVRMAVRSVFRRRLLAAEEVEPPGVRRVLDEAREAALARLRALGAHDPMSRRAPIPGRLRREEVPRLCVRAKARRGRGVELRIAVLEGIEPGARGIARIESREAGRGHAARLRERLDLANVDLAPGALRLARREALHEGVVVEAPYQPVDPAEAQRLFDGLRVGEPLNSGVDLVEADPELPGGAVMLLEPAPEGVLPREEPRPERRALAHSTRLNFWARLPKPTSAVYRLPFESMAMLWTHLNWPAMRPARPQLVSTVPSSRARVTIWLLAPSAMKM